MKRFTILVLALAFTASATLAGFGFAFKRTLVNPRFYSELVNRADLPRVVSTAVGKIAGEDGQTAQVARLAMQRLEPDIRQQTQVLFANLFDYLYGRESTFRFVYDISALQKDPEFANLIVDTLQKNEKTKSVPRLILRPLAEQLVKRLPQEVNLLRFYGIDDAKFQNTRALTMIWLQKIDRYYFIAWVAVIALAVAIAVALRSARRVSLVLGVPLLIAGLVLLLPWIFSGQIFAGLGGPLVKLLRETNTMQVFIAHFISVYMLSPLVCLASGGLAVLVGLLVFKSPSVKNS